MSTTFEREADALRALVHPAVPPYLDAFEVGLGPEIGFYLVHAAVDGISLADEMALRRHSPDEVLQTIAELCDALAGLHGRTPPVLHLNLHTGTVVRRIDDGRLMLLRLEGVRRALMLESGAPALAVACSGPEMVFGYTGPVTDLFAVGALAASLATGKSPGTLVSAAGWPPVCLEPPDKRVEALLGRLLATWPHDRPKSAEEVAASARELLAERTRAIGPSSIGPPQASKRVGRRAWWLGLAACLLAIAGLGAWLWRRDRLDPRQARLARDPAPVLAKGATGDVLVALVQDLDVAGPAKWRAAAVDPDGALRWASERFGAGAGGVHLAVVGDRVLVTDFRRRLHVLDLSDGHALHTVELSDLPTGLCATGKPDQVWVGSLDEKHVVVELERGLVTQAAPPAGCLDQLARQAGGRPDSPAGPPPGLVRDGERVKRFYPALPGEGPDLVVGIRQPGTPVPLLSGLTPGTGHTLWHRTIGSDDEDGRPPVDVPVGARLGDQYVGVYTHQAPTRWHVVAVSSAQGATDWDVLLEDRRPEDDVRDVRLTNSNVWLFQDDWVEVLDAASGEVAGRFGFMLPKE